MEEINELIDELVSKRGPNTGYIKKNQDSDKVARLIELGYNEPVKTEDGTGNEQLMSPTGYIQARLGKIEATLADHEKRIAECSIRR